MEVTNALKMRQNLGAVLKRLLISGEPIAVERNRERVAVLITWQDYQKRFVDVTADEKRKEIVNRILGSDFKLKSDSNSLEALRKARARE